jgi:hypothetical protein
VKYKVTRKCGHVAVIRIDGRKKDRDDRVAAARLVLCAACAKKSELAAMEKFEKRLKLPALNGVDEMLRYKRYILLDGVDVAQKKYRERMRDGSCGRVVGGAILQLAVEAAACNDPGYWENAYMSWRLCINPGWRGYEDWVRLSIVESFDRRLMWDYTDHVMFRKPITTEQQIADLILAARPASVCESGVKLS